MTASAPASASASATETPIQGLVAAATISADTATLARELRGWLGRPSNLIGENPRKLAAYCWDLLERLPEATEGRADAQELLRSFRFVPRRPLPELTEEVLWEVLDPIFRRAWCRETAVPNRSKHWSREAPWIGQELVTVLLIHELFGGKLRSTAKITPDGVLPIWDCLETGIRINPALRCAIPLEGTATQPCSVVRLSGLKPVKEALLVLRQRFVTSVTAWGIAAKSVAKGE